MKKKFMKAGACVLSAAMIMGLYAGPAFADWVENQNGARMWVQDGKAQTGWQQINGKWYYFDESGTMLTGWHKIDGKWYYLDPNGIMLTGWPDLLSGFSRQRKDGDRHDPGQRKKLHIW